MLNDSKVDDPGMSLANCEIAEATTGGGGGFSNQFQCINGRGVDFIFDTHFVRQV